MIRMILFGIGFLGITTALLLIQPGSPSRVSEPYSEPVTRGEPDLTTLALPDVDLAEAEAIAAESGPAFAETVTPEPRPIVAEVTMPNPAPVLVAARDLDDQALRRLTWSTLSGLNQATGRENAPGQPGSLLHTIVRRSLGDTGAAEPDTAARVYVVQEGDSLVSIAGRLYGDMNMTGPLFAANQEILVRPDDLRPGQILRLPQK